MSDAVPLELERILIRCLRKDPQRRWQTMSDLKVALQDLKEDSESGQLRAAEGPVRRGKRRVPLVAAVVLKLAVLKPEAPLEYEISPLTFDSGATVWPSISPGGNLVAYASDREGGRNFDIWIQQVSGGRPLRLTDHPADDGYPCFSPDGSCSIFVRELDPRAKEPAGEEREVYRSPESRFMLNFPKGNAVIAVAADRILFTMSEIAGNIYVAKPKNR